MNGESLEGHFEKGRPHGILKYSFVGGTVKYGTYERGHRKGWTTETEMKVKKMMKWLGQNASSLHEEKDGGDY